LNANNTAVGLNNWIKLTTQWQTLHYSSLSPEQLEADPPAGLLSTPSPLGDLCGEVGSENRPIRKLGSPTLLDDPHDAPAPVTPPQILTEKSNVGVLSRSAGLVSTKYAHV
jgi:hypothetical protein